MKTLILSPIFLIIDLVGFGIASDDFKPLLIFAAAVVTVWGGWKAIVEIKKSIYKPVTDIGEKLIIQGGRITENNESCLKLIAAIRTDFSELKQEVKEAIKEVRSISDRVAKNDSRISEIEKWIGGANELKVIRTEQLKEIKSDIQALERMDNKILEQIGHLTQTIK